MRKEAYKNGEKIGYNQTSAMLSELKRDEDFSFLKEVDSIALQQTLRDLDRGYTNFFQKRASHPTFKKKHQHHQSYRTINQKDNIRIVGNKIKLPKLGFMKIKQSMEIGKINNVTIERTPTGKYFAVLNVDFEPQQHMNGGGVIGIDVGKQSMEIGKINNVTIERTPTGKYFAVLNVDFEPQQHMNGGGVIGIDVGIKEFYFDSNGSKVSNNKFLKKSMRKLVREQRKLSRKQKESHNRQKQR